MVDCWQSENKVLRLYRWVRSSAWWIMTLTLSCGCHFWADGQNIQGVRYFQQGNLPWAVQRFQQAASIDPTNADAYYNLAALYHYQGIQTGDRQALQQAEIFYNQALDHNPNLADAYRGLAVLLTQTDRPDKAFKLLRNWVRTSPEQADAYVELARLYEEYGDRQAAKQQLQEAVQRNPHHARAWRALAAIREKENDYAQALANYQRSYLLQADPVVAERVAALSRLVGSSVASAVPPEGSRGGLPALPRY